MNEKTSNNRLIFHVDVNSAFLSWEAVERVKHGGEDLRTIPSCVGGSSRRSIVSAKSIPAKAYGIQTGESVFTAMRKCPDLVVVEPDFALYRRCSKAFKQICREYAPVVQEFSIDECFLDFTGTSQIYPDPIALAHEIKDRIRDELGFTVNVGVANNKLCAKMASDFEKPDRVHTLFTEEVPKKMWHLPVGLLFLVGRSSADKLKRNGILTIGDLASCDLDRVKRLLGEKFGIRAWEYAHGIDESPVDDRPRVRKSYSHDITVEENIVTEEQAYAVLLSVVDTVARRMRRDGAKAGTISVAVRYLDFQTRSHQSRLERPVDTTREIFELSKKLLQELWQSKKPLRYLSVSLSDLDKGDGWEQLTLFEEEDAQRKKDEQMDRAVDALRTRFGEGIITRGTVMSLKKR